MGGAVCSFQTPWTESIPTHRRTGAGKHDFSTADPRSARPVPAPGRCGLAAQPREALRRLRHPSANPPPISRAGSLRSRSQTPCPRPTMSPNPLAINRSVFRLTRLGSGLSSRVLFGLVAVFGRLFKEHVEYDIPFAALRKSWHAIC